MFAEISLLMPLSNAMQFKIQLNANEQRVSKVGVRKSYLVLHHASSKGLCKQHGGCQVEIHSHLPL